MLDAASLGRYGLFIVGELRSRSPNVSQPLDFHPAVGGLPWHGLPMYIAVEGPTRPRAQRSKNNIPTIIILMVAHKSETFALPHASCCCRPAL
jgi:hypothetical protein